MASESLAAALEREHREIDDVIEAFAGAKGRREPLVEALRALRRHIYLEEEFLFPPLRSAGLVMPVFVMVREHAEMWRVLDAVDAVLPDGSRTGEVGELLRELVALLDAHNPKEEQILYPQADQVLAGPATAELLAFLQDGRLPDGWVCEGI